MENVLLVILLIVALALIAIVLIQRSEGGGLGIGGGSGGSVMSARGAASALNKVTWGLGITFLAASLAMTVVSRINSQDASVIDRVGETAQPADTGTTDTGTTPAASDLLPPSTTGSTATTPSDAPVAPPRAD